MRQLRRPNRTGETKTAIEQEKTTPQNIDKRSLSSDKRNTNGSQTEHATIHKTEHKVDTNGSQTEHNAKKKDLITKERNTNGSQTEHATIHKTEHKVDTNGSQTEHISSLTGNQLVLMNFFFEQCKFAPSRISPPVTISFIHKETKTTRGSIKTTISRLKKKKILRIVNYKDGRGGWGQYAICDHIFNQFLSVPTKNESTERNTIGTQSEHKPHTQPYTQPNTSPSSSSSNILNTITTVKILEQIQTPQNLKSLGFGIGHIKQLKEKFHLSIDEIQKNLESFAYDLDNGELERLKGRGIQNIIGYFFGAIKSGGYNSVIKGFVSAEELAEQEMLERLEKKKAEKEKREKKLKELLFEEWLETKTKDELIKINSPMVNYMDSFHKAALEGYFIDNELEKFKQGFQ